MTRAEAKRILALTRNDLDRADPEVAAALAMAEEDAELRRFWEQEQAAQRLLGEKFRSMEAPALLKEQILARHKIVPLRPWWRQPWLQAAAVLILGLAGLLLFQRAPGHAAAGFANFQARMVRSALREYRMEIMSHDAAEVRRFLAGRGAPSGFPVPEKLGQASLTGGGVLRWRNHPVAMMCFDRGDQQMLFLFVMAKDDLKDPPGTTPETGQISRLATASWSDGEYTYLLAGPAEIGFPGKYL